MISKLKLLRAKRREDRIKEIYRQVSRRAGFVMLTMKHGSFAPQPGSILVDEPGGTAELTLIGNGGLRLDVGRPVFQSLRLPRGILAVKKINNVLFLTFWARL